MAHRHSANRRAGRSLALAAIVALVLTLAPGAGGTQRGTRCRPGAGRARCALALRPGPQGLRRHRAEHAPRRSGSRSRAAC